MAGTKIRTKSQMYDMLQRGLLGNHFHWVSYCEWLLSPKKLSHCYSVRFGRQIGAPWKYGFTRDQVMRQVRRERFGCTLNDISVVSIPMFAEPIFAGELMRSEYGYELHFSRLPLVMREALTYGREYATGIVAKELLRHYSDPSSYDSLMELLDTYDGAVIEFTVFDRDVGNIPHRNTIIWEVRHY